MIDNKHKRNQTIVIAQTKNTQSSLRLTHNTLGKEKSKYS